MAFVYWDMGCTAQFHEYILCIFRNGWMDCRDAFDAFIAVKRTMGTKRTGLWVLQ